MFNHEYDYRTELDNTKFCYQLIITLTKSVIHMALFKIKKQEIPRLFFASSEKKSHLSECLMACTVLVIVMIKHEIRQ